MDFFSKGLTFEDLQVLRLKSLSAIDGKASIYGQIQKDAFLNFILKNGQQINCIQNESN